MWQDANIDLEESEHHSGYQALRKEWTGKPVNEAKKAFEDAKFSVVVVDAEVWQSDNYHPQEIYFMNRVTLFLDENRNVDHICDG